VRLVLEGQGCEDVAGPGDVYGQSVRCLDIAERALQEVGASLADVVRTRVMLTDIDEIFPVATAPLGTGLSGSLSWPPLAEN
jgi:enamine deaminase RidA (YjgF/YER057c/UK114 family)